MRYILIMIETLISHRRPVALPAYAFTAHRIQRMTLTGRHLTPVIPPPALAARIERAKAPTVRLRAIQPEIADRAPRQWPWTLATLGLLVLLIAACAGISLH